MEKPCHSSNGGCVSFYCETNTQLINMANVAEHYFDNSYCNLYVKKCNRISNNLVSGIIESGIFKKIGIIFKPLVKFIFPDLKNDEVIELISCSVCANFLGLGMASTPIVFKVLDIFKRDLCDDRIRKKNVFSLVSLSVSSFSLFPLTVLALREKYDSLIFLKFYFIFILVSFFVSLFTIFLIRNIRYELFD